MKRAPILCLFFIFGLTAWLGDGASAKTPQSLPDPTKNVYEVLKGNKNLGKFAELIDDAGLEDMFTGAEPLTVFAPNDDAMDGISSDMLKRIKASKANMQSFVKYHVITNSLVASSAIRGRKAAPASAEGEALAFDGTGKTGALKVGDATLVQTDLRATNGLIHIASGALVPPSLLAEPVAPVAAPVKPSSPVAPVAAAPSAVPPVSPANATTTPAMPPAETTTGAVPEVTPENPAQQPMPAPAGNDSGKGFTLFGHTFGR